MSVQIYNNYADTNVRVTVSGEHGQLVDEELNVSHNESAVIDDLPVTRGEYNLTARTTETVRSFEWDVNDGCDRLTITIQEDGEIRIQYAPKV